MDQETLDQYLKRSGTVFNRSDLETYVARHGTVNNVDYYIESMRTYFNPDLSLDGTYQVQGIDGDGLINL